MSAVASRVATALAVADRVAETSPHDLELTMALV